MPLGAANHERQASLENFHARVNAPVTSVTVQTYVMVMSMVRAGDGRREFNRFSIAVSARLNTTKEKLDRWPVFAACYREPWTAR
jgi:hypothetical protein